MSPPLEPSPSPGSEPFWEATRRQELVLPWCNECAKPFWYPRAVCPRCLGDGIEWRKASGRGVIHAVSVHHKPGPGRTPEEGPYSVVFVDLDEGVRIMSNVVGVEPQEVAVGQRVQLSWLELSDGRNLPQFTPG